MIRVKISADSKYPVERKRIRNAVKIVTDEYGLKQGVVEVLVVGERKMTDLNKKWMKRQGPTDVLSFPMEGGFDEIDGPYILGDVVVCYPQAVKQAGEKNILVDDEIDALVEHGVRHLLGEHHE